MAINRNYILKAVETGKIVLIDQMAAVIFVKKKVSKSLSIY